MNIVIKSVDRALISLSGDEILAIANAMNECINNSNIVDADCYSRIGIQYEKLKELHKLFSSLLQARISEPEIAQVWKDGSSIQLKAISVFGDPVDMSEDEFMKLIKTVQK